MTFSGTIERVLIMIINHHRFILSTWLWPWLDAFNIKQLTWTGAMQFPTTHPQTHTLHLFYNCARKVNSKHSFRNTEAMTRTIFTDLHETLSSVQSLPIEWHERRHSPLFHSCNLQRAQVCLLFCGEMWFWRVNCLQDSVRCKIVLNSFAIWLLLWLQPQNTTVTITGDKKRHNHFQFYLGHLRVK